MQWDIQTLTKPSTSGAHGTLNRKWGPNSRSSREIFGLETMIAQIPVKQIGMPEDVASVCSWLLPSLRE